MFNLNNFFFYNKCVMLIFVTILITFWTFISWRNALGLESSGTLQCFLTLWINSHLDLTFPSPPTVWEDEWFFPSSPLLCSLDPPFSSSSVFCSHQCNNMSIVKMCIDSRELIPSWCSSHTLQYNFFFSFWLFPSGVTTANHLPPSNPILCILFSRTN